MSFLSLTQYLIATSILCGATHHILAYASPLEERQSGAQIKQAVGTYEYVGCYQDGVNGAPRSLQHKLAVTGGMSAETCVATCQAAGFLLAGLEFSQECWCDSYFLAPVLVPDTDCKLVCTGDSTELCGAGNRIAVYVDTSIPPLTGDLACLTCDQLRRTTGTANFNLTAQPLVIASDPPPIVAPTNLTPFQITAVELPQASGQPILQELTSFTGTESLHTFSISCNNGDPQLSFLETVDPQKGAFTIFPFANRPLQLQEGNILDSSMRDGSYCAGINTINSRSTFIGPPLLSRNRNVSQWGYCPVDTLPDGNDYAVTFMPGVPSVPCIPILLELSLIHS